MHSSKKFIQWKSMTGGLLSLGLLLGTCVGSAQAADRPNVVMILTDDQRADHMSVAGHKFLKTPHMDRIAAEGARFTNMFVTTSLCSPSRASMLSGLYAHAHGVSNNFTDYPTDLESFPTRLQSEGYETAYIGKWHMGEGSDEKRPGFDYWVSHKGQGQYYDNEFNVNGETKQIEGYYTSVVTDLALDWLGDRKEEDAPFLMILGHKAPHTPFTPEKKYESIYDDFPIGYPGSAYHLEGKPGWVQQRIDTWHGIYGPIYGFRKDFPNDSPEDVIHFDKFVRSYTASVKSVDDSVGEIYAALEKMGELDNTVLIFTSDNGFFLGEYGMSDKRTMHEASIKVPLLARYPKLIPAGKVIHEQVLNIDIAPTILDFCDAPELKDIHGQSWKPLTEGQACDWRKAWYYEYNYEKQFPYTPNVRGVRTSDWKYVRYPHGDGSPDRHMAELYHLKSDPDEARNLIDDPKYHAKATELRQLLGELMQATGATANNMPMDEGIKKTLPDFAIR
jgi:N-acetylglucosamine-6-sulfatase